MTLQKNQLIKWLTKACDDDTVGALKKEVEKEPGVKELDIIKTRMFGTKIYVEIEISVDGNMILKDAHDIAEQVHDNIEKNFENVKHCTVHVNPYGYKHKRKQ